LLEATKDSDKEDIPKKDRPYYHKLDYHNSRFHNAFLAVVHQNSTKSVNDLSAEERKLIDNPFYLPRVVENLLRYLLPYYPLRSKSIQSLVATTTTGNPATNSAVELRFRLVKQETVQNVKYLKASRFFIVIDTEKRILEYYYEMNFPRRKRKRDNKEEQRLCGVAEDVLSKKPATEKWKAWRKTKKTVGGLHSETAVAKNGAGKLTTHIDKLKTHVSSYNILLLLMTFIFYVNLLIKHCLFSATACISTQSTF